MRSERDAVAALQRGEIAGLTDLVRLHQLKALRTAYGILGDRAAAEDVVSESFLKVYDRIGSYDAGRPFEPWYYRLLVNAAIDHRRKWRRSQTAELPAFDPAPGGLESQELRISLSQHIRALPILERAALVLHYYLDMDEATMAGVLHCPVGTVKSRLHRARERMRRRLADESAYAGHARPAEGA